MNPDADEVCGDGVDNNCDDGAPECALSGTHAASEGLAVIHGETTDRAGGAVSAGGDRDWDGDGAVDVVAGAPGMTLGASCNGGVDVWSGPGTAPLAYGGGVLAEREVGGRVQ